MQAAQHRQCAMALRKVMSPGCLRRGGRYRSSRPSLSQYAFDGAQAYSMRATKSSRAGDGRALFWSFTRDFVPSGPMASGSPNKEEKVRYSSAYAEKQTVCCWSRKPPLTMRQAPVHFTAIANTNQDGGEFSECSRVLRLHPDAPLREALTAATHVR